MGISYNNPKIVSDGLITVFDTKNAKCYNGIGNIITSPSGATATISPNGTFDGEYFRLDNTISHQAWINVSSITDVRTISFWYYQHSSKVPSYIVDARAGHGGGYFYSTAPGSLWNGGNLYRNGGTSQTMTWGNLDFNGEWHNITITSTVAFTDDMNLFSRNSNTECMDVTFAMALIYDKVITEEENQQNFNALRGRFNI